LKDPPHHGSFTIFDLQVNTAPIFYSSVSVTTTTRVEALAGQALQPAMYPLGSIREEKLVDHSARGEQQLEFLIRTVNTLRNKANTDTREAKPLADVQDVRLPSGEPARVVN